MIGSFMTVSKRANAAASCSVRGCPGRGADVEVGSTARVCRLGERGTRMVEGRDVAVTLTPAAAVVGRRLAHAWAPTGAGPHRFRCTPTTARLSAPSGGSVQPW